MCLLQKKDFIDVPGDGVFDGNFLCLVVFCWFWIDFEGERQDDQTFGTQGSQVPESVV